MTRPENKPLLIGETFCPPEHRTLDFFSGFASGETFTRSVFLDGKLVLLHGPASVTANADTWDPETLYGPAVRDLRITLDGLGLPDVEAEEYRITCSGVTIFRKDTFRTARKVCILQIACSLFLPFSKDWDRLKTNEVLPEDWDAETEDLEHRYDGQFTRAYGRHPLLSLSTLRQKNRFTATPRGYALDTPKPKTVKTETVFPEYTDRGTLKCITLRTETGAENLMHPCLADYRGMSWTEKNV